MRVPIPGGWQGIAAIFAAVLASIAITITLVDTDDDGKPDTIDITVNQKPGDGVPKAEVSVPETVVEQVAPLVEDDLKATPEDAPAPTAEDVKRAAEVEETISERGPPLEPAGAVQGFDGCVTRILPTNFSSRNGTRPIWQVLHYTVSTNRPGWDDVNAIIALFSNPGRQASSNFVIDAEGHCAYIVPIENKAWTQARGNPWSVSYEIIAFGNEGSYLPPIGMAKLKSVTRQVAQRTGIPLRRGSVNDGFPGSAGFVQHKDGGLSWGGHVDISPFPVETIIRELIGPLTTTVLTKVEQRVVRGVKRPKGTGHTRRFWCQQAVERKRKLVKAARPPAPPRVGWKVRHRGERFQTIARNHKTHC